MCDRVLRMKDEIEVMKWTLDSMDCLFVQRERLVPVCVVCCVSLNRSTNLKKNIPNAETNRPLYLDCEKTWIPWIEGREEDLGRSLVLSLCVSSRTRHRTPMS